MRAFRILIADDHEIVRCGVRALLESEPGYVVCGEAATGRAAVEQALALRPDVVVMDIGMPDGGGLDAARRITAEVPGTEVLILTLHEGAHVAREVELAGARGFVLKSEAGHRLLGALAALRGEAPPVKGAAQREPWHAEPLTSREREVLALVARGATSREVAATLGISERTVESHRASLMRKLGIRSTVDLLRHAVRMGWVDP